MYIILYSFNISKYKKNYLLHIELKKNFKRRYDFSVIGKKLNFPLSIFHFQQNLLSIKKYLNIIVEY